MEIADSANSLAGKTTILAIKAAKTEYAIQLNHLKILDVSFIFSELTTPKNLDKYVANEVTKITKIIMTTSTRFDLRQLISSSVG